ncbi:YALI0D00220p [Yarrowia lipolytica CLIB122]|jgi:molecular chaperone HscB|uniref:YALI0D00220p n=2 Tax=Yarrowia lipolytica TaxID=4952 RepID=Q6CAT1_YARLI|nr:YALI0D00220p [Yarrowia lipolytica CLIB122]KAJ8054971.1 Co-chaperone HscB, C-terminal oligomerization domain-containing protein [Yarrowia lipolytica]CAG80417.1 YALI0D00220p [Yarrowia lipolytica CLIB122]|eukprot:XP_502231.1 YALI0D00220p [Yarrowia lipolytica CLIB122]
MRIQRRSMTSFYSYFPKTLPDGAPPKGKFELDPRALRNEFLRLQSQYHPDKLRQLTEEQRQGMSMEELEQRSADLNKAYKALCDPLQRAIHILQNRGIDVDEDKKDEEDISSGPPKGVEDMEALMEIMEVHEAIEEATEQSQIESLKEENAKRIEASIKELTSAFASDDLDKAKAATILLRYWTNIHSALDQWEAGKFNPVNH